MSTAAVNGWNVNRAEFGDGTERKGTLQQIARNRWAEDSVVAGESHFEYRELRRDEWSVYLHDSGRDIYVQLDLHTKEVKYGTAAAPTVPMYVVLDASQRPHGRIVNRVELTINGAPAGALRQVAPSRWQELNAGGAVTFEFDEAGRDDWSVNLHDASRDVRLRIDLHTRTIYLSQAGAPEAPAYGVEGAADEVNGWLVNLVEVGSATSGPISRLSQVGAREWVESDLAGAERFRFTETGRDDWSVYLHDPIRDIGLQIDLYTKQVRLRAGGGDWQALYDVMSSTDINVPPELLPDRRKVNGITVNRVEMGHGTETVGVLRQVDNVTWVEDSVADGRDRFRFDERMRDEWSVYLHDPTRNLSLQLDLHTRQVLFGNGTVATAQLASIRSTSDEPTGWLATEVVSRQADATIVYRQVDWTTWVEVDGDNEEIDELEETGRDDWSVHLRSRSGRGDRRLDLYTRVVTAAAGPVGRIVGAAAAAGAWTLGEGITSRSQLTTLYGPDMQPTGVVYRSAITFSQATRWVDVRATERTEITVRGERHEIDAVKAVRVQPNVAGKLIVSIPATGLHCATLRLTTNLMKPGSTHLVMADSDAHKKLAGMELGALRSKRKELGIPDGAAAGDIDAAQEVMQNLVAGVQYAYNVTPTGVQHDRAVRPANMVQQSFAVDLAGGGAKAVAVATDEAARLVAGSVQVIAGQITIDFSRPPQIPSIPKLPTLESLAAGAVDILRVTVTTGLANGREIVEGGIELLDEGGRMVDGVGDRLVSGDLEGASRELMQGGENMGRVLNERGRNIAENTARGAREIGVIVIETASGKPRSLEASVNAFLDVAKEVIERIGVAFDRFVEWLADEIGWDAVLDTQRAIEEIALSSIADARRHLPDLRRHIGDVFAQARVALGASPALPPPPPRPPAQDDPISAAIADLEALFDDIASNLPGADVFDSVVVPDTLLTASDRLVEVISVNGDQFVREFERKAATLADGVAAIMTDPSRLGAVLLDLLADVVGVALDLATAVLDVVFDVVDALFELLRELLLVRIQIPVVGDVYRSVTGREEMTVGGLLALALALPVTVAHRALTGRDPELLVAAALHDQPQKAKGVLYAVNHFGMGLTSFVGSTKLKHPLFSIAQLYYALVAQWSQTPKSMSPADPSTPASDVDDVLTCPDATADSIWVFQFFLLSTEVFGVIDTLAGRRADSVSSVAGEATRRRLKANAAASKKCLGFANLTLGTVHTVLMLRLAEADLAKARFLKEVDDEMRRRELSIAEPAAEADEASWASWANSVTESVDRVRKDRKATIPWPVPSGSDTDVERRVTWAASLANYHTWASRGGIGLKTAGNLCDSGPALVGGLTLCRVPEAYTGKAAAALHAGEAVIHLFRTFDNALL